MPIDPTLIVPALSPVIEIGGGIVGSIFSGLVVFVVTAWTGRKRDTKAVALTDSTKLDKLYTLMVGDEFTPGGIVKVVRDLQTDMAAVKFTLTTNGFKQPGGKDTVLDILQQTRHNTKPAGGETQPKKDAGGDYDHS